MVNQDIAALEDLSGGGDSYVKVFDNVAPYNEVKQKNQYVLTYTIADISTADSHFVVAPFAGDIDAIYTVLHDTIATSDAAITFELGGTEITGSAITVTASGSDDGDVDSSTPTALNSVTAGQAIEIITDGASTNAVDLTVTFVISR